MPLARPSLFEGACRPGPHPHPPQLSMLRISPSMGHTLDVSLALRHLLFLLEYCMVTGYDWWDTLLHVQPGMVQSLVEKLHEEYTRQNAALQQVPRPAGPFLPVSSEPQPFLREISTAGKGGPARPVQSPLRPALAGAASPAPRGTALPAGRPPLPPAAPTQVLSTRILAMKASLCKLSPCTVARVCDYHAKLFLVAVSSTLKSLLRPHFLNTPDKSPGDRLTEVCTKITDAGGSCPASRELRVPPRPFAWGHPKPHLKGEV